MAEPGYSLRDLIAAASTAENMPLNERTTRQYIDEGLLPPPRVRQAGGGYGEDHLLRLRMVMRLSAQYVPVRDIQRFVERLPAAGLRALLDRSPVARSPSEGDAQTYLQRLSDGVRMQVLGHALQQDQDVPTPRQVPAVVLPKRSARPAVSEGQAERSEWVRIAVDPDVELHVRLRPDLNQRRVLERLTQAVRAVLRDEGEGAHS